MLRLLLTRQNQIEYYKFRDVQDMMLNTSNKCHHMTAIQGQG